MYVLTLSSFSTLKKISYLLRATLYLLLSIVSTILSVPFVVLSVDGITERNQASDNEGDTINANNNNENVSSGRRCKLILA